MDADRQADKQAAADEDRKRIIAALQAQRARAAQAGSFGFDPMGIFKPERKLPIVYGVRG